MTLLSNHLRLGIRRLVQGKVFTLLNLLGLSMGLSIGLVVMTIIVNLTSFDTFHHDAKNIYRVISEVQFGTRDPSQRATCPLPVAAELTNQLDQQAIVTRIQKQLSGHAATDIKVIPFSGYFVDDNFFEVFTFPSVSPFSTSGALTHPSTIVLTKSFSQKLFGNTNPQDRIVSLGKLGDFQVQAVIEDPPANSHLQFELLASLSTLDGLEQRGKIEPSLSNWDDFFNSYVYLKLLGSTSKDRLISSLEGIGSTANKQYTNARVEFTLQPLLGIVPGPDLSSQLGRKMSYAPIVMMLTMVFVILFSACINYTNLSLARSLRRTREVGMRKVLGGSKKQLIQQFLTETILLSVAALVLGFVIFMLCKQSFLEDFPRIGELISMEFNPWLALTFVALAIFTGLISGILPATILAATPVINALKNNPGRDALRKVGMRKGLIVFQFALSLFLLIGVITIYRQYQFAVHRDLGFEKKNKLVIPLGSVSFDSFRSSFSTNSKLGTIAGTSLLMGSSSSHQAWMRALSSADSFRTHYIDVDDHLIQSLGIQVMFGSADRLSENNILVNESFADVAGIKPPNITGSVVEVGAKSYTVAGVVKDFHYMHLEEPIGPFFFRRNLGGIRFAYVDIDEHKYKAIAGDLELDWKKLGPDASFQPKFLEDQIELEYAFYTNFMKLFGYIAFLAISIGSLGLVGMTLYAAQSRVREIGIRKVMGASEGSLVYLLSRNFANLLLLACLFAVPAGYLAFDALVNVSAYHIAIGFVELGTGIGLFLSLGALVIVSQTIKAARTNPVEVLKVE